jgi:RNA polymerase sigma factor (sigma-70 family)
MGRPGDDQVAHAFPSTRRSALAAIGGADPGERRRGFDAIAAAYWRPVYGYLRLHWRLGHDEAADLSQEFFAQLVGKDLLARFDPARARLRTYLRVCIDGLVANERRAARRQKRGGGQAILPFDFAGARAEIESALGAAAAPDELFEKEWARAMFAGALADVRDRCDRDDKTVYFTIFERYELGAHAERPSYADLAGELGMAVTDVTNRLAWVRRALRGALLDRLRACTATEAELRAEARALFATDGS